MSYRFNYRYSIPLSLRFEFSLSDNEMGPRTVGKLKFPALLLQIRKRLQLQGRQPCWDVDSAQNDETDETGAVVVRCIDTLPAVVATRLRCRCRCPEEEYHYDTKVQALN